MKSLFFAVCSCLLYAVYAQIPSCDDFKDGLCKLDADNIVGAFSEVSSAIDCQKLCLLNEGCNFFSFFDFWERCYLVNACDTIDLFHFQGSMSGPREPSLDSCQDITPTYPPTPPTSGPTGSPTTTPPICNVTMGTLCDSHNNVILEVEHLSTPSDCQSICQNHQECNWWSHWVEEGGEHWGRCYLHYSCDILDDHECRECGGIMRPGHRCNCQHGTPWPDLDTCDDGQVHLPCEDDFIEVRYENGVSGSIINRIYLFLLFYGNQYWSVIQIFWNAVLFLKWFLKKQKFRYKIEMFYLNTIEHLFLFVEQLDQLQVGLPHSRLLTGIPILVVFQNLRWNLNKTSLQEHLKYSQSENKFLSK